MTIMILTIIIIQISSGHTNERTDSMSPSPFLLPLIDFLFYAFVIVPTPQRHCRPHHEWMEWRIDQTLSSNRDKKIP